MQNLEILLEIREFVPIFRGGRPQKFPKHIYGPIFYDWEPRPIIKNDFAAVKTGSIDHFPP